MTWDPSPRLRRSQAKRLRALGSARPSGHPAAGCADDLESGLSGFELGRGTHSLRPPQPHRKSFATCSAKWSGDATADMREQFANLGAEPVAARRGVAAVGSATCKWAKVAREAKVKRNSEEV